MLVLFAGVSAFKLDGGLDQHTKFDRYVDMLALCLMIYYSLPLFSRSLAGKEVEERPMNIAWLLLIENQFRLLVQDTRAGAQQLNAGASSIGGRNSRLWIL